MRPSIAIPVVVMALFVSACAPSSPWRTTSGAGHDLVGQIWDVRENRFVTEMEVFDRASVAEFVLLGEKHDNPDHHILQSKVLAAMVERGRRPVVGFEMLTTDQAPALSQYLENHPPDADGLGNAIGWEASGWPAWAQYQPIAEVALQAGLPLAAVSPSREITGEIRKKGLDALDSQVAVRTALDTEPEPSVQSAMEEEVIEAHCGYLPERVAPAVVRMQRVRDALMADNWASAARQADGGVLITGAGHARNDRVPTVMARLRPDARSLAVTFLEVQSEWTMPDSYAELFGAETLPFDFAWFTPRLDDLDPCEKFSASLKRLQMKK